MGIGVAEQGRGEQAGLRGDDQLHVGGQDETVAPLPMPRRDQLPGGPQEGLPLGRAQVACGRHMTLDHRPPP